MQLRRLVEESKKTTITLLCTQKDPGTCHRSILMAAMEKKL
ncbi:MAG TPA: DUF488 family protein [Nitrososphaerales archaeon]